MALNFLNNGTFAGDLYIPGFIYHVGDTDTFFGFQLLEGTFIINTDGGRRLTVTNTVTSIGNNLIVGGTNTGASSDPKLQVETTGIRNTAIFANSGQSFSYTAIKVSEALGNRANLTFVVGDDLAATDLIGEIGCLITSDGGALKGAMSFKTNSGDTLTERMVISSAGALRFNAYGEGTLITDASGNITVSSGGGSGGPFLPLTAGSTKPLTGDLYYNGEIRSTTPAGKLILTNNSTTTELHSAGVDGIKFKGDSDDVKMVILDGGNVGIGATNPLYKLQVQDRIHIEDTATLQPKISFSENTNSNGEFVLEYNGVGGGAVNYVSFYSEVTGWVSKGNGLNYIPQNGYVGIGTTSPDAKLDVEDTTPRIRLTSSNTGSADEATVGAIDFYTSDASSEGQAVNVKIEAFADDIYGRMGLRFYTGGAGNPTEKMRIAHGGNVGIGTTNPQSKLHIETGSGGTYNPNSNHDDVTIEGSGNIGLQLFSPNTTYQYIAFGDPNSLNAGYLRYYHGDNSMVFRTNGSDNMVINSAGNVGIGHTNPTGKLDVFRTSTTYAVNRGNTLSRAGLVIKSSGNFDSKITFSSGANSVQYIQALNNAATVGRDININPYGGNVITAGTMTATNFILSSDERLKENIKEVCDNRIKADWKTFELKTERGQKRYGVIAQELEKTNPEFVREDTQGFKSVAYIDLLIAKIAELEARLEKAGI